MRSVHRQIASLSVRTQRILSSRSVLEGCSYRTASRISFPLQQQRFFSNDVNDDLRKTLHNVNKKYEENKKNTEGTSEANAEAKEGEEKPQESSAPTGPSFFQNILDYTRSGYTVLVENVREAYKEMVGADKQSLLSRDLNTDTYATPKQKQPTDEAETEEDPQYTGSSAIVVVKEGKNAWEQMKERLQEAPFIKEVLRRSRVASKAAAETDLGKKVADAHKNVQDKVSDLREFWETSQNPLVYTISGTLVTCFDIALCSEYIMSHIRCRGHIDE
jgi:hypothetical protein